MIHTKIKNILKNRREDHEKTQAASMGFDSVSEYHQHIAKIKNETRKKIKLKTQKQKRKQLASKIIKKENEFYGKSTMDRTMSLYGKIGTGIEKFGKGMDKLHDTIDTLDSSFSSSFGTDNYSKKTRNNSSKKTKKKTNKKSKRKNNNDNTFGSDWNF